MDRVAKVLIVDDEPLAIEVLETFVENMPELTLAGKCTNAFDANRILNEEDVDLMLLDIQMPQMTGIDFLKSIKNPPLVIFTTAYPNYAVEGFELDAVDYLLKPIAVDRFMKAVNKALDLLELQASHDQPDFGPGNDHIFVKADKKLVKVKFNDILYIEGLKDYVIIRMEAGRVITLQTMKSLEKNLPTPPFTRIHRSYIVNMEKIDAVVGNMLELKEKNQAKHIPIGKNYRENLLEMINRNRL